MKYSVQEDCCVVTCSSESLIFLLISLGLGLVLSSVVIPVEDFWLAFSPVPAVEQCCWLNAQFLPICIVDKFQVFLKDVEQTFFERVGWMSVKELRLLRSFTVY